MVKTKKNKQIKDELARLRQIEKQMTKLERERTKLEVQLVQEAGGAGSAIRKKHTRRGVANYAYAKLKRRRLVFYLITSVGAVFVWAGLWGLLETYRVNHWFALAIGIVIIWLTRNYK